MVRNLIIKNQYLKSNNQHCLISAEFASKSFYHEENPIYEVLIEVSMINLLVVSKVSLKN